MNENNSNSNVLTSILINSAEKSQKERDAISASYKALNDELEKYREKVNKSIECLTIVDYLGNRTITNLNVNDLEGILSINIEVVTGDEIVEVVYEDGCIDRLDSSKDRTFNFNDCWYSLYNKFYGYNFFASDTYDKWKKEKDSYKRAEIAHEWAFENIKEDEEDIECIK